MAWRLEVFVGFGDALADTKWLFASNKLPEP
jgi:hypothetical protein